MSARAARRRLVAHLVETGGIEHQSQLREMLRDEGYDVTQATVSRDLAAVGAVKVRDGGSRRYRIREDREYTKARAALRTAVADFVESITTAGPLIVVRVPPGAANLVAGRIDGAGIPGVLGTVAGDDTVFVAVDESVGSAAIAAVIEGE